MAELRSAATARLRNYQEAAVPHPQTYQERAVSAAVPGRNGASAKGGGQAKHTQFDA